MFKKKIVVSAEVHAKITNWVELCSKEISGLGTITETEDSIYVDDVYLLEQEVTSTDTDLDPLAVSKLMSNLPPGESSRLRFWWHSHVNMGVFWSKTDEDCIETLRGSGKILSIVYNKKGEFLARVDYDDDAIYAKFDGLPMYLESPEEWFLQPHQEAMEKNIIENFQGNPKKDPIGFARFYADNIGEVDGHGILKESLKEYCKTEMDKKVKFKTYPKSTYSRKSYYPTSTYYPKNTPQEKHQFKKEDLENVTLTVSQECELEKNGVLTLTTEEFQDLLWEMDYYDGYLDKI